jgi:ATP-dependent Clp protease ATP-binding subunit ClpA
MIDRISGRRMVHLQGLRAHLEENVIGQHHVIPGVVEALHDGELGLTDPSRPKGTFLFLGPTGVGKTELCPELSDWLEWRNQETQLGVPRR